MDVHLFPLAGSPEEFAEAALLSSVSDDSADAEAIFAKSMGLARKLSLPKGSRLVPPAGEAARALSGVDFQGRRIRKGAPRSVESWLQEAGGSVDEELRRIVREIEERGHRATVVADERSALGVIELSGDDFAQGSGIV